MPSRVTFGSCVFDEMVVHIAGKQMYLWRAVEYEGEVLEVLIQSQRNKAAAFEAAQEARVRSHPGHDRQASVLWGCFQRDRPGAPTTPPTRAQDAAVQIAGIRPALRLDPAATYNTFNVQRHLISVVPCARVRPQASSLKQLSGYLISAARR
jgi:putative transposase